MAYHCTLAFAKGNADNIFFGADTIFHGGPILTVNAKNEEVEALAVKHGKIVAVGSKDAILKQWQTGDTNVIDLKGSSLLPGFVEPHVHVIVTTVFQVIWMDLSKFTLPYDTIDSIVERLKAKSKDIPKGGWLAAFGVDPSRTSPFMAELTANDLDKVSTEVPIFVVNQSAHLAYANHKALELAGITDDSPNPSGGGVFVKDANGKLTGKLCEAPAFFPVFEKIPTPGPQELLAAVKKTM
jgi:predicted amidohydrolase YtcJ